MKKKITALVFLCIVTLLVVYYLNEHIDTRSRYTIEITNESEVYSYHIYQGKKLFIKQDHIPAIDSKKRFCSTEEAKRVAELVVERLTNHENPSITLEDIERLKINLHCE